MEDKNYGFTLIEILLAILIFGILVTALFGSMRMVIFGSNAIPEGMQGYESGVVCLNRMVKDLKSMYISSALIYKKPTFNAPPDSYRITGENTEEDFGQLRFTAMAHLPFGPEQGGGLAEIIYYVHTTEERGNLLKRRDRPYPGFETDKEDDLFEPSAKDPILCKNVKSLIFTYYDQENEEFETWDSDASSSKYATPRGIKISIETGDEDITSGLFESRVALKVYRDKIK